MLAVERLDAGARGLENRGVARQRLGRRVAKIAEDGEVDVRVDVAERLHLEMREELGDVFDAIENRRHDHHRARRRRHALELEPRQPPRRDQLADDPLQNLDGELARGNEREQRDEGQRRAAASHARAA